MRLSLVLAVMLTFALVGCGKKSAKKTPDSEPPVAENTGGGDATRGGGGGEGIVPAGGIGVVVNPSAALGGGGSGGAVQAVRKAARRAQALNEMHNLGMIIEDLRDPVGRMPTREQIMAALKQYPQILTGVKEGAYVLTGTTEGGGLWAYEADADKTPGIALIGGKATRSTPDELRAYFAQMPKAAPPMPEPMGSLDPRPAPKSAPAPAPAPNVTVTKQDMEDIRIYIDNASGASGKMPSVQEVYAALTQTGSPAKALIDKRAIYLTGAKTREQIWAVEAAALQRGGLVCGAGGVETMTAAQIKQRLGIK